MQRLTGKTAIVTGGRQGIGRAIVDRFAAEGARVMTCGRGERPTDLDAEILWQTTDMADRAQVEELITNCLDSFGALSTLVNNAGVQIEKNIVDTNDAD